MRMTLLLLAFCFVCSGCTTSRTSNTARTGMEQLLISNAIDQTLDKVSFQPTKGRKVYLEEKYLESVDKPYILGSLRHKLVAAGAVLVDKKEDSEITLEIRSGGVGTDNVDSFVGVPGMAVPGPMPIEIPEIRVYEKSSQFGTAKLGLLAFATGSGQILFDSEKALARADDNRWSIAGIGPFQSGSVRNEVNASTADTDLTARIANTLEKPLIK